MEMTDVVDLGLMNVPLVLVARAAAPSLLPGLRLLASHVQRHLRHQPEAHAYGWHARPKPPLPYQRLRSAFALTPLLLSGAADAGAEFAARLL